MEGDAVSATVGVLVQNLIDVSKNEISHIRGLDKEANNLQSILTMIQGSLDDAQKKFITHEAVKIWLQELEAVVFEADNVLDELSYRSLAKKMKTIRADKKKGGCMEVIRVDKYPIGMRPFGGVQRQIRAGPDPKRTISYQCGLKKTGRENPWWKRREAQNRVSCRACGH